MAETGRVLRPWDYDPEREQDRKPIDQAMRESQYEDVLPMMGRTNFQPPIEFEYSGLYEPMFGYLPLWYNDQLQWGAYLDSQFTVRLGDAKRILYQEFWWLQTELSTNWVEFTANAILHAFGKLLWELVDHFTTGRSKPVEWVWEELKLAVDLYGLRKNLALAEQRMLERLEREVLMQGDRGDYRSVFLRRYNYWLQYGPPS